MANNIRKIKKANGWAITSLILGIALIGLVLAAVIYKSRGFTYWNIPGWFGIETETSEAAENNSEGLNAPFLHYENN